MKRRAILAFMMDRPGVLNKISMLIRRKMYNVDTLTVCSTNKPGVSRMTITLKEDDEAKVTQVIKQIEKVTEVILAKELDREASYWREVAIVKFESDRSTVDRLKEAYQFEVLNDINDEIFIIQIAGTSQSIDGFLNTVGRDLIIEIARTGVTALEK
jgi:acetolactate synthase I/III small subunit